MMNYFTAIKTAIIIFPLIAFFFTIPFIINQYHKYGSIHKLRVCIVYSFILYLLTIYFLVILPLPDIKEVHWTAGMIHLKPFSFLFDLIRESSFRITNPATYLKALLEPCFYVVFFNILMTMPFGAYLRYYYQLSFKKTILYSFFLSLFFELTQLTGLYFIYKAPYRIFDIDDLFLNTLGGMLGYCLSKRIVCHLPTRREIDRLSIERGKTVSGFRRMVIYVLDILIYMFLLLLISFFGKYSWVKYLVFMIYFGVVPCTSNGQTIGSKILNVRMEFSHHRFLQMILRSIFLYFYYFKAPIWFLLLGNHFIQYLALEVIEKLWFYFLLVGIVLLFYFIHLFILLGEKGVYYDDIFQVEYLSTIVEQEQKLKLRKE